MHAGTTQDHIVIASDSGRIVIVAYNKEHNRFDKARAKRRGAARDTRARTLMFLAQRCRTRALRATRAHLARPARAAPAPQRARRP
jgi:hypothetical protein